MELRGKEVQEEVGKLEKSISLLRRKTSTNQKCFGLYAYLYDVPLPYPWWGHWEIGCSKKKFSETKKFHLVKWDALIGSKQKGGMGVRNLKTQNQCLMMKWLWIIASRESALWKEVIQLKYEMADHWTTRMVTDTYGINLWRSIRNLWPKLRENCSIRTEDGRKVLF